MVPTGIEVWGNTVLIAQTGPAPHLPADGRVVGIDAGSGAVHVVAAGAPMMIDVRRGRGATLFALAQGVWDAPTLPDTGQFLRINGDGSVTVLADQLNMPTSFQVIGTTAYVVTLTGEVWRIDDIARPPYGRAH